MNSSSKQPLPRGLSPAEGAARWAELVPRLCRATMRHESNSISRGTLTLPQFWMLEHLRHQGPSSMHALAAALGMKLPAASMLADRLEVLNLIRRARAPQDRRVVMATLSARGKRAVEEVIQQKEKSAHLMFKALSPSERADYIRLIEKMVSVLNPKDKDA